MIQMNLFTKQKQTHRFRERTYGWEGAGKRVKGQLESLGWSCTLLYLRTENQEATIQHSNSAQYYVTT